MERSYPYNSPPLPLINFIEPSYLDASPRGPPMSVLGHPKVAHTNGKDIVGITFYSVCNHSTFFGLSPYNFLLISNFPEQDTVLTFSVDNFTN